ncbi:MAG: hypothetical protein LC662_05340, partial [Rhodothermaceae bacterium]|nr:hypothetical protein [Rhodothermaceae bacterium]
MKIFNHSRSDPRGPCGPGSSDQRQSLPCSGLRLRLRLQHTSSKNRSTVGLAPFFIGLLFMLTAIATEAPAATGSGELVVRPGGPVASIAEAIELAE